MKSRFNTSQQSPYVGIAGAYLQDAGLLSQKVLDFRMGSIVHSQSNLRKASFYTSCFF
jgi:hypothetical protein